MSFLKGRYLLFKLNNRANYEDLINAIHFFYKMNCLVLSHFAYYTIL